MRYATICSGIGAPELAVQPLRWKCLFQSETEPFPRAVLQHHYPKTKLYEDFREINQDNWLDKIELLVAGTPCQSFSNAGQRQGITEARGNLTLEYIRFVLRTQTRWAVLENVPGILVKDFGYILDAITGRDDLCHYSHWPKAGFVERGESGYSAAWRVLDAQYFGVAQRRRRVFLVMHSGDWEPPCRVLFEYESGEGHPEAGEEEGAEVAAAVDVCVDQTVYTNQATDARYRDAKDKAPTLTQYMGTGGNTAIPIVMASGQANAEISGDLSPALASRQYKDPPIVLANANTRATMAVDIAPTILSAQRGDKAIVLNSARQDCHADHIPTHLDTDKTSTAVLQDDLILRYMSLTETERCFGMPDGYTNIGTGSKSARYKALGNSMVVPVMRWIMQRVEMVA